MFILGKSPYHFPGLDDQAGPVLLEEPSHLVDGTLGTQPLSSPSRSSPHSQGSEGGERFSRKVFVGKDSVFSSTNFHFFAHVHYPEIYLIIIDYLINF